MYSSHPGTGESHVDDYITHQKATVIASIQIIFYNYKCTNNFLLDFFSLIRIDILTQSKSLLLYLINNLDPRHVWQKTFDKLFCVQR